MKDEQYTEGDFDDYETGNCSRCEKEIKAGYVQGDQVLCEDCYAAYTDHVYETLKDEEAKK